MPQRRIALKNTINVKTLADERQLATGTTLQNGLVEKIIVILWICVLISYKVTILLWNHYLVELPKACCST